jgi:hypothetical protein
MIRRGKINTMGSNLELIKGILEKSDLAELEKDEFVSLLSGASDDELSEMLSLFSESPWWIQKMFDNYKEKSQAIVENDEVKWRRVINEEEVQLQQLQELNA